jgi:hypothetical protein
VVQSPDCNPCPAGQTDPYYVCNGGDCEPREGCGFNTGGCGPGVLKCACPPGFKKPYLRCRNDNCELVDNGTCGTDECSFPGQECTTGDCEPPRSRPYTDCDPQGRCVEVQNSAGQFKCGISKCFNVGCGCDVTIYPGDTRCPYGVDVFCGCPDGYEEEGGHCCKISPIVIDVNGDGYKLTNMLNGVNFDFDKNGVKERLSWIAADSDDAWLVLDRNQNGVIDDGTELFGNMTPQPFSVDANGFLALGQFDQLINGGNQDGVISDHDLVYYQLRLWQDANHNGVTDDGELSTLQSHSILEISLKHEESKHSDEFGNLFRYKGKIKIAAGIQLVDREIWDVFLRKQQ